MHAAIQLLEYWALAFLTLGMAVVLLDVFFGLIGNDLQLKSLGQEAIIAGIASLVEGLSIWLMIAFVPAAVRAMIIPAMIVALIYKIAHLEDWSRYDVLMLMVFQLVIGCVGVSLIFGHFQTAIMILFGFSVALAVIAGFARTLL